MTQTQHTPAYRAAEQIQKLLDDDIFSNTIEIANIIDEETHVADMLAFIEEVAGCEFGLNVVRIGNIIENIHSAFQRMQKEAFELLKKVREV